MRRPAARSVATAPVAAPGTQTAYAPRGSNERRRWPTDRAHERLVADRDRPDPPDVGAVAVAEDRRIRGAAVAVEVAAPPGRPDPAVVDGMVEAGDLAVEVVDGRRQRPVAVDGSLDDRLERGRHDTGREVRQRLGMADAADEIEQRQAGHHPVSAVEAVRDRLGAVRTGRPQEARSVGRQDPFEERPTEADALLLRLDEEHREEPLPGSDDGGGEADDPVRAVAVDPPGDDEPLRVGLLEMAVEGHHGVEVVGDLGLPEPPGVVVDRSPPDRRTGGELVRTGRADVRLLGPEQDGHAAAPASGGSSPDGGRPVASRSSSACMKASRSPSRTAPVFEVS